MTRRDWRSKTRAHSRPFGGVHRRTGTGPVRFASLYPAWPGSTRRTACSGAPHIALLPPFSPACRNSRTPPRLTGMTVPEPARSYIVRLLPKTESRPWCVPSHHERALEAHATSYPGPAVDPWPRVGPALLGRRVGSSRALLERPPLPRISTGLRNETQARMHFLGGGSVHAHENPHRSLPCTGHARSWCRHCSGPCTFRYACCPVPRNLGCSELFLGAFKRSRLCPRPGEHDVECSPREHHRGEHAFFL